VLIVEDDPIVAEIYRLALERAGLEVLVAGDGQAGLETAIEATPDFLFLDIRLPKMDGIEVLRQLKDGGATRDIPVVMLSNFDDTSLIRSSMALGAKQYLVKVNTDPTELPGIVAQWVNRP
jgi:CheY-like chemotaxis protein